MAWIELHQTLPKNKKTLRFKRKLRIKTPQAVGHLSMLWLWALDNAEDGDLSDFSAEDIAEVCEWTKDPQQFLDALIDAGFVDISMKIHDWDDYMGRIIAKREVQREQSRVRQQRYRERVRAESESNAEVTRYDNAEVTRYESVSNAPTVPYHTVPIISGASDARACAREDDFDAWEEGDEQPASVEDVIANASNYKELQNRLAILIPVTRSRFYRASGTLYSLWDIKNPTEKDHLMLFWIVLYMHGDKSITMDDGYIELLTELFMVASRAGKKSISYLFGIARRLRERGISTIDQYWDFQAKRDLKKA